ncbi:TrlF family AAA-like ATPase [Shewanella frigidimarina]|uniref:TrlF family AAA-like ATPase n=1 Tax=Shewanella frigidimarina TaxID=56812 RepID=UPI003D7AE965
MQNKGAEWNLWDLHFHTPSSYDYKDKTVTNQQIIDELKAKSISVVAITDHHIIDIERIAELQSLGASEGITVLPGIEFLSDARGKDPIHFIGIFPENCDLGHVWGQLTHKTDLHKISLNGVAENTIYVDLDDTISLVKKLGGITTIHAGGKSGSVENITHSLPHNAAQKTNIALAIDIYELGKESDQTGYRQYVFPHINKIIPMIICSDNHHIHKYQFKQNMWIKGDTNFEGLRYALNEPESRFYIGAEPPVLTKVKANSTKYLSNISINRTGTYDSSNKWFEDINIPLNKELITIIGHKGNGKSAVSDIIAMCADSEHSEDFLFLHKNKFKKRGLADRFSATLTFESGRTLNARSLSHSIDPTSPPLVRYLPQSYFEKVCNEIGKVEAFRTEIEKVVFQYVPEHKRMDKGTFNELIEIKQHTINSSLSRLVEGISGLNDQIISLEKKSHPDHLQTLRNQKTIKEEELAAHLATKPLEIKDPSTLVEDPEIKEKKDNLQVLKEELSTLEKKVTTCTDSIASIEKKINSVTGFKNSLTIMTSGIEELIQNHKDEYSECGLNIDEIITVNLNIGVIDTYITGLETQQDSLAAQLVLDEDCESKEYSELTLASRVEKCKSEIKSLQEKFTGEQLAYQNYLTSLSNWESNVEAIRGEPTQAGTLSFINESIRYIEEDLLPALNLLRTNRISKSLQIFDIKSEVISFYDEVKLEIDRKLDESDVSGLNITSSFYPDISIASRILSHIKQNRSGSFYGADEGLIVLKDDLLVPTNWNEREDVSRFLTQIIHYLEYDKREEKDNAATHISDIVKTQKELYDMLFGLGFLTPYYDLRQNSKSLDQLSPGEKGALLLVFYLVLDKEDIPLIIDQPEDNLDNNSVATVLVPYIKEAKKHRQIIMVTHNPNLAVVSDSEQVIKVNIDKENGNKFSFNSGGIETNAINAQIVEVLEGTVPAFTSRKNKYRI